MQMIWDAGWRAWADCWRPKVLWWSIVPLLLLAAMAMVVGGWWWEAALQAVQHWLQASSGLQWLWRWVGAASATLSATMAAVLLVLLLGPLLILLALGAVAVVMTPPMVEWVAQRRFPYLQRKRGAGWLGSVGWAIRSTAVAVLVLVLSLPLWLLPPLMVVLPALIGGWLTYRVMAFDALAEHASASERHVILSSHRVHLLWMGVMCGLLSAAPSVVWASGLVFVAAFWVLIPVAMWMYALILAFSTLWFVHYGLAALYVLRAHGGDDEAVHAPGSSKNV